MVVLEILLAKGMSFIYIMNKCGTKIDPCGTPVKIFVKAHLIVFISTHRFFK